MPSRHEALRELGITKSQPTHADIHKAYKALARTVHPDKGGNKESFQRLQLCYEYLLKNVPAQATSHTQSSDSWNYDEWIRKFRQTQANNQKQTSQDADNQRQNSQKASSQNSNNGWNYEEWMKNFRQSQANKQTTNSQNANNQSSNAGSTMFEPKPQRPARRGQSNGSGPSVVSSVPRTVPEPRASYTPTPTPPPRATPSWVSQPSTSANDSRSGTADAVVNGPVCMCSGRMKFQVVQSDSYGWYCEMCSTWFPNEEPRFIHKLDCKYSLCKTCGPKKKTDACTSKKHEKDERDRQRLDEEKRSDVRKTNPTKPRGIGVKKIVFSTDN